MLVKGCNEAFADRETKLSLWATREVDTEIFKYEYDKMTEQFDVIANASVY